MRILVSSGFGSQSTAQRENYDQVTAAEAITDLTTV